MIIALTGARGAMGSETLKALLADETCGIVRVLVHNTNKTKRFLAPLASKYGDRLQILYGDVRNKEDCLALTKDVDYVLHLAAVIPPRADHEEEYAVATNYGGTVNMVDSVVQNGNTAKFVHISTVATYGNRDEKHPWGRVGDPLLVSPFDVYGTSKLRGERYVLDSPLTHWAILRQTGILYDNMLMNNIQDGLMFHTPWNVPIEWVTAQDSGRLMHNIVAADRDGAATDFWRNVYNIGGGQAARTTGYETFDDGFKLIGGSVKSFFEPRWNMTRNFHCFWFSDSDVLEKKFAFRTQGCADFWQRFSERHKLYAAGEIVPAKLIRKLVIEPLLDNSNAPMHWLETGQDARIVAGYGSVEQAQNGPEKWEDFDLLCERADYEALKTYDGKSDLDHGYDESKANSDIDTQDLVQAAAFRGGECLGEMVKGDLYTKVQWRCHQGHTFAASPYTVLKAGHWCPVCCMPDREWHFDELSRHIPFFHQVWQDTHTPEEAGNVYRVQDGQAILEKHSV